MIKAKKIIALLTALALLSGALLLMPSCTQTPDEKVDETVYYTVRFNTVGGSEIEPMKVLAGKKINQPPDPTRDNYIFFGWLNGTAAFDFEFPIKEDTVLTARWMSADSVFSYLIDEETQELTVTGVKEYPKAEVLSIPSVIKGFEVTQIGDGAFGTFNSDYVITVNIPESVRSIGAYAFEEFPANINVNGCISSLGEGAFSGCVYLTAITLGEGLTEIPYSAFSKCVNLKSVIVPDGTEIIEENAFKDCASLITIVLPATVSAVKDSAFHGCDSLKTVFFGGDQAQFDAITAESKNDELFDAKVYFYSETEAPDCWHFDEDGKPKLW